MCLIEDHIVPLLAFEKILVAACKSVRRNTNVEVMFVVPSLTEFLSPLDVSMISENLESGKKFFELHFPVQQDTCRNDDQMRSPDATITSKMGEKCDCLNCFSGLGVNRGHYLQKGYVPQAHLIRKDTIPVIIVIVYQPFHSAILVRPKDTPEQQWCFDLIRLVPFDWRNSVWL